MSSLSSGELGVQLSGEQRPIARRVVLWLLILASSLIIVLLVNQYIVIRAPDDMVSISAKHVLGILPIAILFFGLGLLVVLRFWRIPGRAGLFFVAFWMRVLLGIVLAVLFQYDDEIGIHNWALRQLHEPSRLTLIGAYYYLTKLLYGAFGGNFLILKIFNALIGALLPFFAYDLARWLFLDEKAGYRAMLLTAFLPPLVDYSATSMKEIDSAFLLILIVWFAISPHMGSLRKILGCMVSLGMFYWLRLAFWGAIPVLGLLAYLILMNRGASQRSRSMGFAVKLSLLLCLICVVVVSLYRVSAFSNIREDIQGIFVRNLGWFVNPQATVSQFLDPAASISLKNLAVLLLRGLYSPSPLRFLMDYNLGVVIQAFDMGAWYLFSPFAITGFLMWKREPEVVLVGIIAIGIFIMASVAGDAYRHRIPAMGLIFVLAAGGLRRSDLQRWILSLWWLGALLFTVAWWILRTI